TAPRARHLGCADPLGRRRRGARLPAARAQLEALALRATWRAARLLRLLRRQRHLSLRRRHVRARSRPRADPVPRFALPSRRPERRRAARLQRSRAAARPAAEPAPARARGPGLSLARARR